MPELEPISEEIETISTTWRVDRPHAITFTDASRTKQSDRDSVNINSIVAKYNKTGILPGMKNLPEYGDFTASTTLHESMNIVKEAEAAFASLPAEVRAAVGNDPGALLDLVADPAQRDKAIELGLIEPDTNNPGSPRANPDGGETPAPSTPETGDEN